MVVNSSLPIPVSVVEQRPLPVLYSPQVVRERFDTTALPRIANEQGIQELDPDLISFKSHGEQWRRARAYFNDYSFMFDHTWRESGRGPSSLKSNLKVGGTYDNEGEVSSFAEGKGLYIDHFS